MSTASSTDPQLSVPRAKFSRNPDAGECELLVDADVLDDTIDDSIWAWYIGFETEVNGSKESEQLPEDHVQYGPIEIRNCDIDTRR